MTGKTWVHRDLEGGYKGRWLEKVWHIYTLEFYSVVKNNDILNFAYKWMEIENTLLSEVTETQKEEYGMYSLISRF